MFDYTPTNNIWNDSSTYASLLKAQYGLAIAEQGAFSTSGLVLYGYLGNNGGQAAPAPTPVAVLPPAPITPPSPPHLQFTASPIGTPTFLMLGNCRMPGQIIWADGIDASNTVLDTSFLTFAACSGEPIDPTESVTLTALYANGTKFWENGAIVNPDNMNTTDLAALEACLSSMAIYYGTESQTPDPMMEFIFGVGNVPAFRGLRYIVFQDFPLVISNNSIPNITAQWTTASLTVSDAMDKLITHVHTRGDTRRTCSPEIDGISAACQGITITSQDTLLSHLQAHKIIFGYQITEGSPVKLVRRAVDGSLVIDKSVNEADVIAQKGAAAVQLQRINPTRLPFGIDLQYMDVDWSYDNRTAMARHNATRVSSTITSCYCNYSMNATTARTLSYDILYLLRSQALTGTIELDDAAVEVSDIVNLTTTEGDVHTFLVQQQTNTKTRSNQLSVLGLLSSQGANVNGDGGDWYASAGKLYWPEDVWSLTFDLDSAADRIWCFGEQDGFHLTFAVNYLSAPQRRLSSSKWRDLMAADTAGTSWGGQDVYGYFSGFAQIAHDDFYFYFIQDGNLVLSRIPKTSSNINDIETITIAEGFFVDGTGTNDNINYSQSGTFAPIHNGKLYIPWTGRFDGVGASGGAVGSVMKLVVIDLTAWSNSSWIAYDFETDLSQRWFASYCAITDSGKIVIGCNNYGSTLGRYYYADITSLGSWSHLDATFPLVLWTGAQSGDYVYFAERYTSTTQKTRAAVISTTSGGFSETVIDLHTQDSNFTGWPQHNGVQSMWVSGTHLFASGNKANGISTTTFSTSHERPYLGRFDLVTLTAAGGRYLDEIWYNGDDHFIQKGKYDNGKCYIALSAFGGRCSFLFIDEDLDPATAQWYSPRPSETVIPTNNYFATPQGLPLDVAVLGDLTWCNTEPTEPIPAYLLALSPDVYPYTYDRAWNNGHSAWYKFHAPDTTSPSSTSYTIEVICRADTFNPITNFGIQVYTGTSLSALTPIAGVSQSAAHAVNGVSPLIFDAISGTDYMISVTLYTHNEPFGGAITRVYRGSSPQQFYGAFSIQITGPASGGGGGGGGGGDMTDDELLLVLT